MSIRKQKCKCGAKIHNEAKRCRACWVKAQAEGAAKHVCPCGKPVHRTNKLCWECHKKRKAAAKQPGGGTRELCPNGCGNYKRKEALMCQACRLKKQAADREQRHEIERQRREQEAQARLEHQTRLAENKATDIDLLRDENTELRTKLRQADSAIASYRSHTRIEDRMVKEILEYIEKNPYRPQLRKPRIREDHKAKAHQMLANISDAHYPEVVDPAAAMGLAFNGDICMRRLAALRDTVVRYKDLRASSYGTSKLTMAVNGDMLSGVIHEELEVTNQYPMAEALTKMAHALFDMGNSFAEEFPEVEMIVMPGNHPRIERKPRSKQKWNNWEHVMGRFIQGMVAAAGNKWSVVVPKDLIHVQKIFNMKVGITHGDGVKAQSFAGIPWYAMKQRRDALQALLKSLGSPQLDLLCYGHFHQLIFEEGQGCSLLINGSIKGGDEYSLGQRYAAQIPVQALLTFHPEHGITDLSRINLGHIA